MAQNLFNYCIDLTVAGIKNLKLSAKEEDGSSIDFPIDVVIKNGDDSTILGSINEDEKLITIGNQTTQYVEPYIDTSSFEEVETKDRRGTYYTTTIEFQFPKVSLYTNNQLKDFLFTDDGALAIANAYAIITDNNDRVWCAGYDLPLVVEELDVTTGGGDNNYRMLLVGKSYDRVRVFEEI